MRKSIILIMACVVVVMLSACGNINKGENKDVSSKNKLKIYTTVFAFQSFTEQIGGKYVDVKSIYPPGADMHTFEPTQKEMVNIAKGDLFIYSNQEMDPVAKKIAGSINNKDLKLALAANFTHDDLVVNHEHDHEHEGHEHAHEEEGHEHEGHEHEEGSEDPHVWLDPVLNKKMVKSIKDDLAKKDPQHKDYYENNYKQVVNDLDNINQRLTEVTEHPKRDTVVISHDSIGYLANRYGFKQEGVSGMNNEEPSQRDLMNIVNNIKQTKQPYVLYEQNISSKVTDVIQKESNSTPLSFHNMATLSKEESKEGNITYQSLMKRNIKSLDKALNE
ncbi:zinc ABC transporter substrate-binding protein [Staphylococcus xylosus]|uniref:metal ABC transporter solute-binding protein, Zn/Mn family n=1 Tax=Staphylococcus xylosus TaxID=1288 RepID=UPI002DBD0E54|nr:zinc ABC transporter substrate-binding protein [Staphylococcus xylosus]MEB6290648.1 zinc ABC transporter substrate-binding protein [Staphylococcus xylosus]MEB6323504.1 zinc ABC transporter substrate-binding protein [Staphylococcus xylosus]MEB7814160.1 zinc ABC transporter substrate-binding protein [Staphylococcus xylosus]MEB7836995.1 zinc ABC transporter substrate-binding protein [Staphylococcus xylosus]MEB7865032.1 zinc ABC transporter substrate-binding protein [Staphylococcus xylosus]